MSNKIVKTFSIDWDVIDKIRKIADYEDRSLSEQVSIIFTEHLDGKYNEEEAPKIIKPDATPKSIKENLTVTIDKELLSKIEENAKGQCRSTSRYINRVLKNFLKEADYKFE